MERGFHHIEHAVGIEIAVVNVQRTWLNMLIASVFAPVAGYDVHSPVAVEVARSHAVPPAGELVEGRKLRVEGSARHAKVPPGKPAAVVAKNAQWPPFAREHEVGIAISIEIGKDGTGDQAQTHELLRVLSVENPTPIRAAEEHR